MALPPAFFRCTRFWLLEGVFMINVVELDERIHKCLSILQQNGRSRIFAALAEAYRRRGEVGRAFSVCKNGLRIHPDYGAAHVVMARLYLHQKMIEQARTSVARAIELDGPSRSSDLLLAEIHLESGEFKSVRQILNSLSAAGGSDPAVQNLRQRLRHALKAEKPVSEQTSAGSIVRAQPQPIAPQPPQEPAQIDHEISCMDPHQAVEEIKRIRGVVCCGLWREDGTPMASRSADGVEAEPVTSEAITLFSEVDNHTRVHGWGGLCTLRIEGSHGQWGMLRQDGMVALVLGSAQLGYAAATRKAAQCMGMLAADHAPKESGPPVKQSRAEHSPQ